MKRNYTVKGNSILADMTKLNKTDMKEIKNYLALGFELKPTEKTTEPKEEYTKEYVKNWYKENIANGEDIYDTLYNMPVLDENGKPKTLKDGKTVKVKGHMNTVKFIKEIFKDYPNTQITEVQLAIERFNTNQL